MLGTYGDNPCGVNCQMTPIVMGLNDVEMTRGTDVLHGEYTPSVRREIGVLCEFLQIAFKVTMIDGVESYERREQTYVGFGELFTCQVRMRR